MMDDLLQDLVSENPVKRNAAVTELAHHPEAIPRLIAMLHDFTQIYLPTEVEEAWGLGDPSGPYICDEATRALTAFGPQVVPTVLDVFLLHHCPGCSCPDLAGV